MKIFYGLRKPLSVLHSNLNVAENKTIQFRLSGKPQGNVQISLDIIKALSAFTVKPKLIFDEQDGIV